MEKSENYYVRQEYMQNLTIPTFTKIKNVLGEDLGNAVIAECPEVLKNELGIEPKLHGAGDTLWTSPSDLLEGLVVLKPPFTNRYIKALTHEGIMSIGMEIENKFRNEMEQKCKRSLSDQEEMLVFIAEQERIKAVRDALAERMQYYEEKFESFENDFEKRLQEELELLTTRLLEDYERLLQVEKEQMEHKWQENLVLEVEETTKNLTMRFLEELETQELELTRKYGLELKKLDAKHENTLELEQEICKETLKQLKHNLECKNISNLIYILCMERRKCEQIRLDTEQQHDGVVATLSKEVELSAAALQQLEDSLKVAQEKIVVRERCLEEILKQFQKFVYFALKAAPKQGEFLLNIEKLLLYELAETVSNLNKKSIGIPIVLPTRLPPEEEQLTPQGLSLPEDHNCLNEFDPPEEPSEELFSVIFNDKLYVREDFRNMISQGIEIRPSNDLWNKDVEELIGRLKKMVEEKPNRQSVPHQLPVLGPAGIITSNMAPGTTYTGSLKVKTEQKHSSTYADVEFDLPVSQVSSRPDRDSRRSSVYFVESKESIHPQKGENDEEFQQMQSTQKLLTELILENKPGNANNVADIVEMHRNNSILLCAKDSLDHHRMSIKAGSIRDDIDLEVLHKIKQKIIDAQEETLNNVDENLPNNKHRDNSGSSRILEKIRKINEEAEDGRKDVVEKKKSIEEVFSKILVEEGILTEEEIMKKKEIMRVKDMKLSQAATTTPRERRYSGLSMAQDSLEIIKSKTAIKGEEVKETFIKAIDDTFLTMPFENNHPSPAASNASKRERISIVEEPIEIGNYDPMPVVKPTQHTPTLSIGDPDVIFNPLPKVYRTASIVVNQDRTWRVYEHEYKSAPGADKFSEEYKRDKYKMERKLQKRDNFLKKENVENVAGSEESIKMSTTAFTVDRVHSLLGMLKEDSSLMRIFTGGVR